MIQFVKCEVFTEDVVARRVTAIVKDLLFLFVRDWLLYSHLLSVSEDLQGVAFRIQYFTASNVL